MKCPACGHHNFPGSTPALCGRCGQGERAWIPGSPAGGERARSPSSPEDVYPPRAHDRTWMDRSIGICTAAAQRVRDQARESRFTRAAADLTGEMVSDRSAYLVSALSLLPGLGQCAQRRWRAAACFMGGWLALA